MVINSKCKVKEALDTEWQNFTHEHYGTTAVWEENTFRFKATENGKIIGTIDGKLEPGILYIAALMVTKDARGKGIGKLLIEKAEEFGKRHGAHRTWLSTGKDWSSRAFYEKTGFKKIADLNDFYFHKDFVVYSRLIS